MTPEEQVEFYHKVLKHSEVTSNWWLIAAEHCNVAKPTKGQKDGTLSKEVEVLMRVLVHSQPLVTDWRKVCQDLALSNANNTTMSYEKFSQSSEFILAVLKNSGPLETDWTATCEVAGVGNANRA